MAKTKNTRKEFDFDELLYDIIEMYDLAEASISLKWADGDEKVYIRRKRK